MREIILKAKKVVRNNYIDSRITSTDANVSSEITSVIRVHLIKEVRSEKCFVFLPLGGGRKLKGYVLLGGGWPKAYQCIQGRKGVRHCRFLGVQTFWVAPNVLVERILKLNILI